MFKLFQLLRDADPEAAGGAPAPAATPAAETPVQTPAPEQTPPAVAPVEAPAVKVTYKDPAAKQVADMLSAADLDPSKVRDALADNSGNVTPEIYAALRDKHGEGLTNLLVEQLGSMHKAAIAKGEAQRKEVYDIVEAAFKENTDQPAEQSFAELDAWAKENVDNEERKELNKLIKQGGLGAKFAIESLINKFKSSGDFTQEMSGVDGDTTAPVGGGQGLSRAEYDTELNKALAAGEDYHTSPKIKALQARRQKGMQQGL